MGAGWNRLVLLSQLCALSGTRCSAPPPPPIAPVPCPCSDPALCKPLSPIPQPKDEVVAFPGWEIYGGGYNDTVEKLYDWSKITTIAPFQPLGPKPELQQLYCDAHKHGVKVLDWSAKSWNGTGCGVTQLYSWCRTNSPEVYNQTAILAWAESTAACLAATGFDGVMLDGTKHTCLWFMATF